MEFFSELARRKHAVESVESGMAVSRVASQVGRSREWVHKWLRCHAADGEVGLVDRSRIPKSQPTKTSQRVVDEVLEVRAKLEKNPVANIGALSILATMERERFSPLPSIATIERILSRAGVTHPVDAEGRSGVKLPLPQVTTPGVWQQADWVQDRYLEGGIRFNSLQIADVGSHGVTAGQFLDRKLVTAVTFLIERVWPTLSIPQAISTDNAFVHTTHRHNPFTAWARACLWFGTEVIVGPPGAHGWNNHIEAVNHLWQRRTIWAQRFANLDELRAGSERACWWFNHHRPVLDPDSCGTRYPVEYITAHRDTLRWPPEMTVADHLDRHAALTIPLSAGRVTFIRHVTEHHTISLAGALWEVPPVVPKGGLVVATCPESGFLLRIGDRSG
jgi:transposase-like protein